MIMYNIGDLIIYGTCGVCEIKDITNLKIHGIDQAQLYYILKPFYESYTISTPVDNSKVFMRPIITKEEATRLIRMIPAIQAEAYYNDSLNQLVEHYESIIGTFDGEELIRMTMSIFTKNQMRDHQKLKPGAIDKRYMKRAEDLLFGEFAVALEIPKEEVAHYIAENLK